MLVAAQRAVRFCWVPEIGTIARPSGVLVLEATKVVGWVMHHVMHRATHGLCRVGLSIARTRALLWWAVLFQARWLRPRVFRGNPRR